MGSQCLTALSIRQGDLNSLINLIDNEVKLADRGLRGFECQWEVALKDRLSVAEVPLIFCAIGYILEHSN